MKCSGHWTLRQRTSQLSRCELVLVRLTEVLIRIDTLGPVLAVASPVLV
jgi:hypothetical protein